LQQTLRGHSGSKEDRIPTRLFGDTQELGYTSHMDTLTQRGSNDCLHGKLLSTNNKISPLTIKMGSEISTFGWNFIKENQWVRY
jgi:hypothetical protein